MPHSSGRQKVAGISMVRNVADIVGLNLLHHLNFGIDVMYVVDNGSTDATGEILAGFAERFPVEWRRDNGPFLQDQVMTALAREAFADGATWVVPVDSDEFWWCRGDFREKLAATTAAALRCNVVHFIQHRSVMQLRPAALLTMNRRVSKSRASWQDARLSVESRGASFVEAEFPTKSIFRPTADVYVHRGSHGVDGLYGESIFTDEIECLHAPLRARDVLELRVDHGQRLNELAVGGDLGWQSRRWSEMATESKLDSEWVANSYSGDFINVYGSLRPVMPDNRLAEIIRPWLNHELVRESPAGGPIRDRSHESTTPDVLRDLVIQMRLLSTELTFAQESATEGRKVLSSEIARVSEQLSAVRETIQNFQHGQNRSDAALADLRGQLEATRTWAASESAAVAQRDSTIIALEGRLDRIVKSPAARLYRFVRGPLRGFRSLRNRFGRP